MLLPRRSGAMGFARAQGASRWCRPKPTCHRRPRRRCVPHRAARRASPARQPGRRHRAPAGWRRDAAESTGRLDAPTCRSPTWCGSACRRRGSRSHAWSRTPGRWTAARDSRGQARSPARRASPRVTLWRPACFRMPRPPLQEPDTTSLSWFATRPSGGGGSRRRRARSSRGWGSSDCKRGRAPARPAGCRACRPNPARMSGRSS